jgi:hypothetical protein
VKREVSAVSPVRVVSAAAVLAAAVAVYAVVRRDRRLRRQLARERVEHRLTDACLLRDLEEFRGRLERAVAQQAVADAAGLVLDAALAAPYPIDPPEEGDPR